ncbi:Na(+)-translocating NADH-quinone reductase subunit C [Geopsychrobacter electrodiphilus]|uniref:Na(+)-translocating NADH-quinone reductase subunit C n=1 Tax=Geopsychrobacter electrodiphilus TaxID=225196 RepID=UPI000362AC86|nr:Na(+)-translocating NADH-quinone reductase subunit C [Geopsychrobacter electrodiphilus]
MSRDSTRKVLGVAFLLCLICSILVSVAAVGLHARQEKNKTEEKRKNILQAAGLYQADIPVEEQFSKIETRILDLKTAKFTDKFSLAGFDSRTLARDPASNRAIPQALDLAHIKVRSRYKAVYLVITNNQLQQLILPVHGKGLWSTMYGFISLASDLTTVKGFAFYEHGETPGLGGEIDNPNWKKQWPGKKIYDEAGNTRIEVLKGRVDKTSPDAIYQADGLSGATLTGRGVSNLLKYWMGEDGYKPFLEKLKKEGLKL